MLSHSYHLSLCRVPHVVYLYMYIFIYNKLVQDFRGSASFLRIYVFIYLSIYLFIHSFIRSFVLSFVRSFARSSVFYHSAEVIIFLGLSSLFFRQQCRLSILVKSRKTLLVVFKTFPKKAKSELLWQLHHFLPFPYSPPVPVLCVSILLFFYYFFHFMFFLARHFFGPQCNRNSKDRIILGSWEPAHLPLP